MARGVSKIMKNKFKDFIWCFYIVCFALFGIGAGLTDLELMSFVCIVALLMIVWVLRMERIDNIETIKGDLSSFNAKMGDISNICCVCYICKEPIIWLFFQYRDKGMICKKCIENEG